RLSGTSNSPWIQEWPAQRGRAPKSWLAQGTNISIWGSRSPRWQTAISQLRSTIFLSSYSNVIPRIPRRFHSTAACFLSVSCTNVYAIRRGVMGEIEQTERANARLSLARISQPDYDLGPKKG